MVLVRSLYRLPLTTNDHFQSGVIFGILRQNSSKIGHFTFGSRGPSFAVTEIRLHFRSGVIFGIFRKNHQNESFYYWSMGVSFAVT
jgi:hypothetical protein